ncbi:fibronectin type III domain-containing protein [Salibacter halophilus]|uniref:Fibronectin type-III domain-containing protein n=1 Tax=Salibacter halophilus TaxID=1803916 RepID=A0A6N6M196_9FLAO|nr:hypothetical protein [Salibacter halophilus]KAB1061966.1 hypothetical protein F3059_12875 [Salibacter halophilus]
MSFTVNCIFKELRIDYLSVLLVIGLLSSCDDIIEKDISDERVSIIAPADSLRTEESSQFFIWNEIDGASEYQLQIVSPSFKQVRRFELDTTINDYRYEYSFTPGVYQWRVRAKNGSYETPYATRTIIIDSSLNLSNTTVFLTSPPDNSVMREGPGEFRWSEVYNANYYVFRLVEGNNFDGGVRVVQDEEVNTLQFNYSDSLPEGDYTWGVSAENQISKSAFSTRTFTIDRTPPTVPQLTSPNDGDIVNPNVTLTWNSNSEYDSLIIGSDGQLNQVLQKVYSDSNSYSDSLSNGTYYWTVKSFDNAGNVSQANEIREFMVQ